MDVFCFVLPFVSVSEAYGGEDAFAIPRSERVGMAVQHLGGLLECQDVGELLMLWHKKIAYHDLT